MLFSRCSPMEFNRIAVISQRVIGSSGAHESLRHEWAIICCGTRLLSIPEVWQRGFVIAAFARFVLCTSPALSAVALHSAASCFAKSDLCCWAYAMLNWQSGTTRTASEFGVCLAADSACFA